MCTYRKTYNIYEVQYSPQFQALTRFWNVFTADKEPLLHFKGVGRCRDIIMDMQNAELVTESYNHSEGLKEQQGNSYSELTGAVTFEGFSQH